MDAPSINEFQKRVSELVPGAVLEANRFGRAGGDCLWIDSKKILEVVDCLITEGMGWLENLSVMQLDQALVLTYFFRSPEAAALTILRVSLELGSDEDSVEANSISGKVPLAEAFEIEAAELFGIHFTPEIPKPDTKKWSGYPLRKGYPLGA